MKSNKSFITSYEQIHGSLETIAEPYFRKKRNLKDVLLQQKQQNEDGLYNSLIEIPEGNISEILIKEYTKNSNATGLIGTIEPENQAYEIKNIALLILMCNRESKKYKTMLSYNEDTYTEKEKTQCKEQMAKMLRWKDRATSDLISSLYVLENTGGEEYENYFSYGKRIDDRGKSSFVIDLPFLGQISVHFGNKEKFILDEAKNKTKSILEKKKELGQITQEDLNKINNKIQKDGILQDYTGTLFEYFTSFPMEYVGPKTKQVIKKLGFDQKVPEEIDETDIRSMSKIGLNEREAYYLGIKLGFPKNKLEEILNVYNEKEISKGSLRMTNVEERKKVAKFEKDRLTRNDQQKVVGG